MRTGPRHPHLGNAVFKLSLPLLRIYYQSKGIFDSTSRVAIAHIETLRERLRRGETLYLGGICAAGTHNTGVALIEVSRERGPKIICNNEEERFSGERHTTRFPTHSIAALNAVVEGMGLSSAGIDGWFSAWDSAALSASLLRAVIEEAPASLAFLREQELPALNMREHERGSRAARKLSGELGHAVRLIATPHHDNHAWLSYSISPFARSGEPVMVATLDGFGDRGAISLYLCQGNSMQLLSRNDSMFDSLGVFYAMISSTQGGWTMLSSEGRYMGAAAWGNHDRATNSYYRGLKDILVLEPDGVVRLNRSLANWAGSLTAPYTDALVGILGEPIAMKDMWNPDAVLRVEDIRHKEDTQERLDKAAATQMVFEDALMHVVEHLIRRTGSARLVLTGGAALNATGNMRLLERFDGAFYRRELGRDARLHLWVPPVPNDAGVALGAAYMGAYLVGASVGEPLQHAFYCGSAPGEADINDVLAAAPDVASIKLADLSQPQGLQDVAELMAFVTAQDGIIALYQGAAETGPRALGHRSILANPCNPQTRELLNARVKYREAIRPLAPLMTREAALRWFELSDGADDDDYNAYNYMVLIAKAKPEALATIPSVIHADGTGRLQIVRKETDPLTHAYLKALGRRIGVEVAVNTSFNVGGPIAQTPEQALSTLRRSKGMDAVIMVASEGTAYAVWQPGREASGVDRFPRWLEQWKSQRTAETP